MTSAHGSVRAWLMRVAHNLAIDSQRVRSAYLCGIDPPRAPGRPVTDSADTVASTLVVEQALATLSHSHRVVVEQTVLHDRTAAEAARVLGVPLGTVKSRLFYALRRLREEMMSCHGPATVRVS